MYVLIVLVAGAWLAYPVLLSTKEDCDKSYEVVAQTFEENKAPRPDHICAFVVYQDEKPETPQN